MKQREEGTFCPLIKKDCVEFKCKFWTKLVGKHPQVPGQTIDEYDCSWKWMPFLMIENTKETIEMTASINSFRNEMVVQNDKIIKDQLENHEPNDLLISR